MVISDAHERRLGEAADALARSRGPDPWRCRATSPSRPRCSALYDTVVAEHGRIDVAINNAGLGGNAPIVDMTDEQWSTVLDITLTGTFRCMRAELRHMYAQGSGVIVNNSSVLGWRAQADQAHYAAAKAGVMALTRCAAVEAAAHGVRVNAVAPSLALHPFLNRVFPDDELRAPAPGRAVRPLGRDVGGRQRHGLPGQRLLVLHERRDRLGLEPAPLERTRHERNTGRHRGARDRGLERHRRGDCPHAGGPGRLGGDRGASQGPPRRARRRPSGADGGTVLVLEADVTDEEQAVDAVAPP